MTDPGLFAILHSLCFLPLVVKFIVVCETSHTAHVRCCLRMLHFTHEIPGDLSAFREQTSRRLSMAKQDIFVVLHIAFVQHLCRSVDRALQHQNHVERE